MKADRLDDAVESLLRRAGQRYTRSRRCTIACLRDCDGPMTIPEILEAGGDLLVQSSLYRNLAILEEIGVVTRIVTNDSFARYELAEEFTEHHHHLICAPCGSMIDFHLQPKAESELERALRRVARGADFDVGGHRLDLVGVCSACR